MNNKTALSLKMFGKQTWMKKTWYVIQLHKRKYETEQNR